MGRMNSHGPSHRILVVDDEPNIVDVIAMALRYQGFEVETAADGRGALRAVADFRPHLIVLDIMLPDMEGFEVAERLGAQRGAGADHLPDRARRDRGQGARPDDAAATTTSRSRSASRSWSRAIRTILRRAGLSEPDSGRLVFEDLELDEDTREVTRAGQPIELTATEYRLLHYLMLNPRRVLTRGADPRPRLGLRLRRRRARARDLRQLPAQEARPARPAADPHRARGRLRAARRRGTEHVAARRDWCSALLALAALGLLVAGAVTYAEQKSFLEDRVDAAGARGAARASRASSTSRERTCPATAAIARGSTAAPDRARARRRRAAAAAAGPRRRTSRRAPTAQRRDARGEVLGNVVISYGEAAPTDARDSRTTCGRARSSPSTSNGGGGLGTACWPSETARSARHHDRRHPDDRGATARSTGCCAWRRS